MNQLSLESPLELLRAEFSDVEEMCASVRSWDLDFRPLRAAAPAGAIGRIIQSRSGPLELCYARFSVSLEQGGAPPPGLITFVIPGLPLRRLWWRGQDVGAGTVLVFPVGSELRSFSGPDFEIHTVSVSEETVARLCERFQLELPIERLRPEVFRPPTDLLDRLRHSLRRMGDKGTADAVWQAHGTFEELVLAWARESIGAQMKPVRPERTRDRAIRRCLERIEHSPWHELSASTLCESACVGERTLQLAFRERFGLTPAAFLKARRLALVRQQLVHCNTADVSIGQVAAALGFTHAGQLAADYRCAFGETPSETLTQMRA
jgi:AraC family transcriptional regulator, ethanolamine operon transcriptional activator